jgi:hypothetical protein
LNAIALKLSKKLHLIFVFHTLRNYLHFEAMGQLDDGLDDRIAAT